MSEHLEDLLAGTASSFASAADFQRTRSLLLAGLLNLGRHTISGALTTAGRQHHDWSADYRMLQRLPVEALFAHIQRQTLAHSSGPWIVAVDDTTTRKRGRHIPGCGWRRDPLSPPFQANLHWGQRILQCSAALPAGDGSARLIPVDWTEAPLPKKPSRTASASEQAEYGEARRQANINVVAAAKFKYLRGQTERPIHFVVDGRFTNRTVLRELPDNTVLIGRVPKDTKLYQPGVRQKGSGRPRRYGPVAPTPEQLRTDEQQCWQEVRAWAVDREHTFKVKRQGPVMARIRGVAAAVQIVVIAPLGYPAAPRRPDPLPTTGVSAVHRSGPAGRTRGAGISVALGHRGEHPR